MSNLVGDKCFEILPKGSEEQVAFADKAIRTKRKLTFVTEKVKGARPFLDGVKKILILGPGRVAAARAFNMCRIRKLSKMLRAKSNRPIGGCHPAVASVLRASGSNGLHVCLFDALLKEIGWVEGGFGISAPEGLPAYWRHPSRPHSQEIHVQDCDGGFG